MNNRVDEMEVFVRAVELGSFSGAARRLHVTPSAVSKLITRIEDRLGVRLLVRSNRNVQLTSEGEIYYDRAVKIVGDIAETERAVSSGAHEPRGLLRVNANIPFGVHCLAPLIPQFLARYPDVTLDLSLTDSVVDLVDERADVAIRSGILPDSQLKARKLFESYRVIVGAPAYLERHGTPKIPEDLLGHNCLNFNFRHSLDEWPFIQADKITRGSAVRTLRVTGNLQVNNGETMRQLALAGIGLARLSTYHVGPDVTKGRLLTVLDANNPDDLEPIHAMYVGHQHLSNRIRAFVDFLAEHLPAVVKRRQHNWETSSPSGAYRAAE